MTEKVFVDSNVLVYAYDVDSAAKQRIASQLLKEIWAAGAGVISIQVLHEFYVTVTRKLHARLLRETARGLVHDYSSWEIQAIEPADVIAASELEERFQLSYWDALLVLSASKAGAKSLLSEDLNPGQVILGVRIENPFRR
jgi:predicted nucleic acid-binding protein